MSKITEKTQEEFNKTGITETDVLIKINNVLEDCLTELKKISEK